MSNPKVKRVLMSVTDKSGVADFARALEMCIRDRCAFARLNEKKG